MAEGSAGSVRVAFMSVSDGDLGAVLLEPLTSEQQIVVDLVCQAFFSENSNWPKFQYVEWELDRQGLDLRDVLATFPVVGASPGLQYGALGGVGGLQSANETSEIAATVNGLWHCRSAARETARAVAFEVVQVLQLFDVICSNRRPNECQIYRYACH